MRNSGTATQAAYQVDRAKATPTCVVPTAAEIIKLGAKILPLRRQDLIGINQLLPTRYIDNTQIILHRPDIFRGLQPWRGLGQEPPVNRGRFNRYGNMCVFDPGYWGETKSIGEMELARLAEPAQSDNWAPGQPLNAKNEIGRIQDRQTVRMLTRMEKAVWDSLRTGQVIARDEQGEVIFQQFYAVRHARAAVDWDDIVTSAPLATLRSFRELFRDSEATFHGSGVTYYMNATTLNRLLENRNANDIGRGSLSSCCNTVNLEWINAQLNAQGLGKIVVYDKRWIDDKDGIHLFLPDGWVIVIGERPDTKRAGSYMLTKVINNGRSLSGNDRGIWYYLKDDNEQISRKIVVGTGHNGLPVIEYPEMVISLQCF